MFNLSMVHSCVYSGAYGLANINISSFDAALCYCSCFNFTSSIITK